MACAPPAPPVAAPPARAAPRASECRMASVPVDGLAACMPGTPEEVQWSAADRWIRGLRATADGHVFLAARTIDRSGKGDGEKLLSSISAPWQRVDENRPFQSGGFQGRALAGTLDAQRRVMARAFVVGNQVYLAQVEGPMGGMNHARAQAFLESLHIDVPWRIHASYEGRFTVAVPAPARWLTETKVMGQWAFAYDLFALSSEDDRVYGVAFGAIPTTDQRTADEILDENANLIGAQDGTAILKMKPVTLEGVPGRELVFRNEDGILGKVRIYATRRRVTMVILAAARADALDDAGARRFFDSFQITEP
jgi:hypothetical protein